MVAVEIGSSLLELGEILHRLECALRSEQALNLHPAQRRGGDAMTGLLWAGVGRKVRRLVGVAIRMTIEASCAAARQLGATVLGLVELLLRERCHQKTQALELFRGDDAIEQLVVILDRYELALRDVAEVRALVEVDRRRELRQEMIRDVVLDVETRQIAAFLPLDLVDQKVRKHEP